MATFGLIGYPLGHSLSPDIFFRIFKKEGAREHTYSLFPLESMQDLRILISDSGLDGVNITIPHKKGIIAYLDEISAEAQLIGAVNTITVNRKLNHIHLEGYNTDAPAFLQTLSSYKFTRRKAIVLGSGGSSSAVCFALKKLGFEVITVSRQPRGVNIGYQDLDEKLMLSVDLIVNTSPVGMNPHTEAFPDIPYHWISRQHFVYDLIYNPEQTMFLKRTADQGARTKNGMEMLMIQAGLSWEIWKSSVELS